MPRQVFEHDHPDRFVAGTVGEPGSRTFYLQARSGNLVTSVALEKLQVSALAERVEEILDEMVRLSGGLADVPALAPAALDDLAPLDTPLTEEFRVGTLSLTWDGEQDVLIIEALAVDENGEPETESGEGAGEANDDLDLLRVSLTAAAARSFAKRALAVVSAGRPPCPFCGQPLDPGGHVCPRQNGYRRR